MPLLMPTRGVRLWKAKPSARRGSCRPSRLSRGKLDGRSDLYSLGTTAYFLLTGQVPFDRPNVIDIFSAHLHKAPAPLTRLNDDVPVDLQEVVLHCLEKQAADRFPDAVSLDRALMACRDFRGWTPEQAPRLVAGACTPLMQLDLLRHFEMDRVAARADVGAGVGFLHPSTVWE